MYTPTSDTISTAMRVEFGIGNFVLFNDAWSQKGHSASNTTVILGSSSIITSIIITYYHHFRDHVLTFISITNLLYFLVQVFFFEEGKNMGIITRC